MLHVYHVLKINLNAFNALMINMFLEQVSVLIRLDVKPKRGITFGMIKEFNNVQDVTHNVNLVLIMIPNAQNAKIIYMYWQAGNAFRKPTVRIKLNHSLLKLLIKSIHAALALVVVNNALIIKTNAQNAKQQMII